MSTTTTRQCDRCELAITDDRYSTIKIEKQYTNDDMSLDLCWECTSDQLEFLRGAERRSAKVCLARTFAGENCQRDRMHKGDHVYTSPADGASISWSDERKR